MHMKKIVPLVVSVLIGSALWGSPSLPAAAAQAVLDPAAIVQTDAKGLVLNRKDQDAYIRKSLSANDDLAHYHFQAPQGWQVKTERIQGVKTDHYTNPQAHSKRVLLDLHGGGYVLGLSEKYRLLTAKIGNIIDARDMYLPDYRLAPQYTYPAALEDAVAVYKELLKGGTPAQDIVVYGDSAGGNLALELSLYLKDNHLPQPGALVLASPWTNLRSDSPSWQKNRSKDLILGVGTPLYEEVQHSAYAGKLSYDDPRLSPVQADLSGLPPMLIQMGSDEIFLDDGVRLARKAAADDTKVTLTVYPTMSHDFALVAPKLEQSRQSLIEIRDFVDQNVEK